jgi:histidine kinase
VHDIAVELEMEEPLPPVWADANRLEQVFINLVLNARDSIEERRAAGRPGPGLIRVAAAGREGRVVVSVADNGAGVPPELEERIFEPFFTTKEVGKGTGLGLSISYGIVRDYNGSIEIESRPGEGATFRVSLPAAPEEA